MPFFKRKDSNASEQTNGNNGNNGVDKVNFKARLDHKTFIVSLKWIDNLTTLTFSLGIRTQIYRAFKLGPIYDLKGLAVF